MKNKYFLNGIACFLASISIIGCSGESDEAKRLGFSSIEEMQEIQAKGWHTKDRFEEDTAKQSGFSNASEMNAAVAKKKEEEEKNKAEKAKQEIAKNEAEATKRGLPSKWAEGIEYRYYSDGSCKESDNIVCMSPDQFKAACESAKGVTSQAIRMRAMLAPRDEKILLEGGGLESVKILYGENRGGNNVCSVTIVKSGLVDGNSKRIEAWGNASAFIKSKGEVLVHYFSNM